MVNAVSSSENSSSSPCSLSRFKHDSKSSIEAYDSASITRSRRRSLMRMNFCLLAAILASRRLRGLELLPPLLDPLARLLLVRGEFERNLLGLAGEQVERGEDERCDDLRLGRGAEADHPLERHLVEHLGRALAYGGVDLLEAGEVDQEEDGVEPLRELGVAAVDLEAVLQVDRA